MKQLIARLTQVLVILAWVCPQAGCERESPLQATPLLTEASPDETHFSSFTPTHPYADAGNNLLTRTVFETQGPADTRIELRDLFVAPGKAAEKVSLPGPAVLEVLGGEGRIVMGDKAQKLVQGTSLSVAQNTAFSLESRGIAPLVLRTRIFIPETAQSPHLSRRRR